MKLTRDELEQYNKQAGIVWTAATAKIAQARMAIAKWINIDNTDCKLYRLTWIGSNIADADRKMRAIDTNCRKIAEVLTQVLIDKKKPSEDVTTLYSRIIAAYEELEDNLDTVRNLLK